MFSSQTVESLKRTRRPIARSQDTTKIPLIQGRYKAHSQKKPGDQVLSHIYRITSVRRHQPWSAMCLLALLEILFHGAKLLLRVLLRAGRLIFGRGFAEIFTVSLGPELNRAAPEPSARAPLEEAFSRKRCCWSESSASERFLVC